MKSYLNFIRQNRRLLAFGMSLTLFSGFGQTFFLSISAPELIRSFDLSNATWGGLYAAATLMSACTLPSLGRRLDHSDVSRFSMFVALGLAGAALLLCLAPAAWVLLPALYGLRLCGQGLMGLTASTTMARVFDSRRGVALSISSMGFPIGEILFPPVFFFCISSLGWRVSWAMVCVALLAGVIPLFRFLVGNPQHLPKALRRDTAQRTDSHSRTETSWSRWNLLKDPRFIFLVAAYATPPFLATGLILNQFVIAQEKSWPEAAMAGCFVAFGVTRLTLSLAIGPLIDRFSARRVFPLSLIPFTLAVLSLWLGSHVMAGSLYYGLIGISVGMGSSTASALWAEIYGIDHLGSIKSVTSMIGVLGTAISPVLLGFWLDSGHSISSLFPALVVGLLCLSTGSFLSCRTRPPHL